MTSKTPTTPNNDVDFNTIVFEKRLAGLKDSQDSINTCCHWCLQNRQHHKKIVSCWLNVLKRVKIEQRLTLFYLANDVIQYSKRRNYDFVGSWGTTLQKATTLVRDEKVKHKILRIFKIWEQRGIYGEEFILDLCGLISVSPTVRKGDETHEFQPAYLIQKIRTCSKLEIDTDTKLKELKEHNPKIQIESESLTSSLKDRAHVDDVEKELDDYSKETENYINALKLEIKTRINLISLLSQARVNLDNDRKDVKLVTTAYRTFAARLKALKKKLDEKRETLVSPIPSPDINAPSPSPDSDIELLGNDNEIIPVSTPSRKLNLSNPTATLYTNAGYYNPVPPPTTIESNNNFNNNFSSFMGANMPFNLQNLNTSSMFENDQKNSTTTTQTSDNYTGNNTVSNLFSSMSCPPPPPTSNPPDTIPSTYGNVSHVPLLPPPMPPFNKAEDNYGVPSYGESYGTNNHPQYEAATIPYQTPSQTTTYQTSTLNSEPVPTTIYQPFNTNYPPLYQNPGMANRNFPTTTAVLTNQFRPAEEYNPEENLETWKRDPSWEPPPVELDTPESPPLFEKKGYEDPIEYHDGSTFENSQDIDHRVLPAVVVLDEKVDHRIKDVDHRNLISLTSSPSELQPNWKLQNDQDYRKAVIQQNMDQDYRVPFNIESFKLPPPPPPPNMVSNQSINTNSFNMNNIMYSSNTNMEAKNIIENIKDRPLENILNPKNKFINQCKRLGASQRKVQDNTEDIDMDLSDDDQNIELNQESAETRDNDLSPNGSYFELPPPFPDLFDDVDANNFLDEVTEDLDLDDFSAPEYEPIEQQQPPNIEMNMPNNTTLPFIPNFIHPNSNMFNTPPPVLNTNHLPMNVSHPEPSWQESPFNENFQHPPYQNEGHNNNHQSFPNRGNFFRGRGGNIRGNFNNRGMRGGWNNRGGNEFRGGRGRGGLPRGNFRGNRSQASRGGQGMRMPRGGRGWMDGRGRGSGHFRGGFNQNF